MNNQEKAYEIMKIVFKEVSEISGIEELGQCNENTILFGPGAKIDSLNLVSLVVDLESKLSEKFSQEISLTDDRAMTREISPFDTFGSLKNYIEELVSEIY